MRPLLATCLLALVLGGCVEESEGETTGVVRQAATADGGKSSSGTRTSRTSKDEATESEEGDDLGEEIVASDEPQLAPLASSGCAAAATPPGIEGLALVAAALALLRFSSRRSARRCGRR